MTGKALKAAGISFPIMGQDEASFWRLPGKERALLVAAHLADVVKIREQGANSGTWVARILRSIGLGTGHAWCAAFVSYCCELAEYKTGPKSGRGRVLNWYRWAKEQNLLGFKPERGDLVFMTRLDGTGHIEFIVSANGNTVPTIGGNTNKKGDREGDGAYRQERTLGHTWRAIRLP